MISNITQNFGIDWHMLVAQSINALIVIGLFALAARVILIRGKGWEVPVWLVLSFIIPVIFPIIALIHFRQSKFATSH